MNLEYRPYQQECINLLNSRDSGRFLVVLATGLGKTAIATGLKRKGRTLILSHRDELVNQPRKYFDCSFGVEKAEQHSDGEEVVSASVQTLSRGNRLDSFEPDAFDTIIVDEAHHSAAPTYKKILNHFSGAKKIIGLTATPNRGDGVGLADVFDEIIFYKDLRWGIENGYLSRVRCKEVYADYTLDNVKKTAGDFNQRDLEDAINQDIVIDTATETYIKECHNAGRHTLAYCVTTEVCDRLYRSITDRLPKKEKARIRVLTGMTPDDERKEILAKFAKGQIRCIINCMVLTEGVDLPIADTILNLRPTCNPSLFAQMVGRGTRLYDGKDYCLIFDILPTQGEKHRSGLCSAPTLFGIDPDFMTPEQAERLTENYDLLEICDEVEGIAKNLDSQMAIVIRDVGNFLELRENMIEKNVDNFKVLAGKIDEETALSNDDPDFGNLEVEKRASEKHRYCIRPNYTDYIYISAPDLLDNSAIEFQLRSKTKKEELYFGKAKINDAIQLAYQYCYIQADSYKYQWDKNVEEAWKHVSATAKQKSRILNDYKRFNVKEDAVKNISKLDASRLIDMSEELKKQRKYFDDINITGTTPKRAVDSRKKKFKNQFEYEQKLKDAGGQNFAEFKADIQKRYKEKIEREEKQKKEWLNNRAIRFGIGRHTVSNQTASNAQISFIASLIQECNICGFIIDQKYLQRTLTMKEASVLIDLLLKLKRSVKPQNITVTFSDEDLDKTIKEAASIGAIEINMPYSVDYCEA